MPRRTHRRWPELELSIRLAVGTSLGDIATLNDFISDGVALDFGGAVPDRKPANIAGHPLHGILQKVRCAIE